MEAFSAEVKVKLVDLQKQENKSLKMYITAESQMGSGHIQNAKKIQIVHISEGPLELYSCYHCHLQIGSESSDKGALSWPSGRL